MNHTYINNKRWICLVEVACSTHEEYATPDMAGAYVNVVADAEDETQFINKVRETLENEMEFPVVEISEIELLTPEREIPEDIADSIQNLLPHFPIAFGSFHFFASEE